MTDRSAAPLFATGGDDACDACQIDPFSVRLFLGFEAITVAPFE